nr:MAG TPA: hypothetical protein [Caudoviricetes sp.]
MKVKITKSVLTVIGRFEAGSIVVISDGTAEMLIREGFAEVPKSGKQKNGPKQEAKRELKEEPKEEPKDDQDGGDAGGAETASQS